jgi:hypothetical protein
MIKTNALKYDISVILLKNPKGLKPQGKQLFI